MHLLIPSASALSTEVVQLLPGLALPNLTRLLGRLSAGERDEADEYTMSPPHERALAAAWRWQGGDGLYPFGALAAEADGIDVGEAAWGLVTPSHWHVGRDHVSMADPEALALDEAGSRACFEAVRELFEGEGCRWEWGAPDRWYAAHPDFATLPTASLDRVIGRNVDHWLGGGGDPAARASRNWIRRLQSEVQLLLYPHAINEAREARGELAVNTFWLSGCGRRQPADVASVTVDATLRRPLLDGDSLGWTTAWSALDAGAIAQLAQAADRADGEVTLTLCGERSAQRYERTPRSLWQRLRAATAPAPAVPAILAAL
jgi:hypothetical protein